MIRLRSTPQQHLDTEAIPAIAGHLMAARRANLQAAAVALCIELLRSSLATALEKQRQVQQRLPLQRRVHP